VPAAGEGRGGGAAAFRAGAPCALPGPMRIVAVLSLAAAVAARVALGRPGVAPAHVAPDVTFEGGAVATSGVRTAMTRGAAMPVADGESFPAAHKAAFAAPMMAPAMAPDAAVMSDAAAAGFGGPADFATPNSGGGFMPPSREGGGGGAFVDSAWRDAAAPPEAAALEGPVIHREGSVALEGADVRGALDAAEAAAVALGGYAESSSTSTDDWLLERWRAWEEEHARRARGGAALPPELEAARAAAATRATTNGHVSLRIPARDFEAARGALRSLIVPGSSTPLRVVNEHSFSRDVTESYVDTVARQRVESKALAQLEALLTSARNIGEILSVKREADALTARLEGTTAARKSLEGRAR
jgi:hypothetical protein